MDTLYLVLIAVK